MFIRSPLRYPGGKQQAAKTVEPIFPDGIRKIVSPFFGGGSVELALARRGVRVRGFDAFKPLVAFWKMALRSFFRPRLVRKIRAFRPIMNGDLFHELRRKLPTVEDEFEQAVIYFVLNRASVNAALRGYSYKSNRFTENSVKVLEQLECPGVSVDLLDFREAIPSNDGCPLLADPPYDLQSGNNLYGYKGELHRDFDHEALAELVKRRSGLSLIMYNNDSTRIRWLYRHFRQWEPPEWFYGMSRRRSRELLIFSDDFPLPPHVKAECPTPKFQVPEQISA